MPAITDLPLEMFGWEEDRVPKTHIEDFNVALDGVGTLSEFVTKKHSLSSFYVMPLPVFYL